MASMRVKQEEEDTTGSGLEAWADGLSSETAMHLSVLLELVIPVAEIHCSNPVGLCRMPLDSLSLEKAGVPKEEVNIVSSLFGTKIALNEFIAYMDMAKIITENTLSIRSTAILTVILCGFANFSSIAIQVGGLSQMAPERKSDFAECGFKSMICGALVSCISGCIVGIIV